MEKVTIQQTGIGPLSFTGELVASERTDTLDIRLFKAGKKRYILSIVEHRPAGDYHWAHIYRSLPDDVIASIKKGG